MKVETFVNKIFKKNLFENLKRNYPDELNKIISRYSLGLNTTKEIAKELEISESELIEYIEKNNIEKDDLGNRIFKDFQDVLYELRDYSKGDPMKAELILMKIKEANLDMADSMSTISKKILNKLDNCLDQMPENKTNPGVLKQSMEVLKLANDTFNIFEKPQETTQQTQVFQDNRQLLNVKVKVIDPREYEKEKEKEKNNYTLIEDLI